MSSFSIAMPRPVAPPTPQPSTEISSKNDRHAIQLDVPFTLPPAALNNARESTTSSTTSNASDSSYHPTSPTLTTKPSAPNPRERPSASLQAATAQDGYSLPPPPTRSRKIIQMKPKGQQQQQTAEMTEDKAVEPTTSSSTTTKAGAGGKKKQSNGNTAAGRKIARKTAHSLIERRRRSKMNEEFGVLKDMIPACAGQEMHKLAILQASIDYMRYLEQCVTDLKASHKTPEGVSNHESPNTTPQLRTLDEYEDSDSDEPMSDAVSPTTIPQRHAFPPIPHSTNTSPAMCPKDHRDSFHSNTHSLNTSPNLQPSTDPRNYSVTSSIRSTATSPSILPSPAFSTGTQHAVPPFMGTASAPRFAPLTSPALRPQTGHSSNGSTSSGPAAPEEDRNREDHEATAALLMLNSDRRNWSGARGMSVRDLLSG